MANMGYCRFQNTLSDLRDCRDAMDDRDLSTEERQARSKIIRICMEIAEEYGDEDRQS